MLVRVRSCVLGERVSACWGRGSLLARGESQCFLGERLSAAGGRSIPVCLGRLCVVKEELDVLKRGKI